MVGEEICVPIESQVTSRQLTVSFVSIISSATLLAEQQVREKGKDARSLFHAYFLLSLPIP